MHLFKYMFLIKETYDSNDSIKIKDILIKELAKLLKIKHLLLNY
jgi:hypothetical protein